MITLKEISRLKLKEAGELLISIPTGMQIAASNALNRAAIAGRAAAVKKARESYYISAAEVRSTITITNARKDRLITSIRSKGTRRELINYKTLPNTIKTGKKIAVLMVAVKKSTGVKPIPGAFIQKGTSSGQLHVLKRDGSDRYPIHIKYGPSVPEMLGTNNVRAEVEERANTILASRLDHEITRLLTK